MSSMTPSAALAEYRQQRISRKEHQVDQRKKGAKIYRYIGILTLFSALGLGVTSIMFMTYTANYSENLDFVSMPVGLVASALGLLAALCGFCSSRFIAKSEDKSCIKTMMLSMSILLSFMAASQCVLASAMAGATYFICTENPGPAPDPDTLDFRQCVTYRSAIKITAVFLILSAVFLFVMCMLSMVNFCRFKKAFGVCNRTHLLQNVDEDINSVQYIMNIQAQYPPQSGCSIQELQEIQLLITSAQEKLTEVAFNRTVPIVGLPFLLMNHQAKLTALQQHLNTQMQMLGRPQQPAYPFQPEVGGQYDVAPSAQDQSRHHHGYSHEGQPLLNPHEGKRRPMHYYTQGQGEGQHVHHPQPEGQPYLPVSPTLPASPPPPYTRD